MSIWVHVSYHLKAEGIDFAFGDAQIELTKKISHTSQVEILRTEVKRILVEDNKIKNPSIVILYWQELG